MSVHQTPSYSTPTPPPLVLPLTYVLRERISGTSTPAGVQTHSLLGCHDRTGGNIAFVGNTHGPSIAGGLVATDARTISQTPILERVHLHRVNCS